MVTLKVLILKVLILAMFEIFGNDDMPTGTLSQQPTALPRVNECGCTLGTTIKLPARRQTPSGAGLEKNINEYARKYGRNHRENGTCISI